MEVYLPYLFRFTGVLLLVLLNGLFVASEFAIVRAHPTKLKHPSLEGSFGTRSSLLLIEHLDRSLSATQLGITIASLILGWLGEEIFAEFFLGIFHGINSTFEIAFIHAFSTALALIVVTVLHVVIGELAAKSIAIQHPETTLRIIAPTLLFFSNLFRPAIFILNGAASLFLSMFGVAPISESERVHTSRELSMLISQSTQHGELDKSEEEMLKGVFEFSETIAREVMTPRIDLVTIPVDAPLHDILATVTSSGFSRFPIVQDNVDDVVGLLLARDLLTFWNSHLSNPNATFSVKDFARECYFVPGTKPVDDLLNELKHRKIHMAIVLDEHGGVDGAVTLEDLVEEIVGDIYDESDEASTDLVFEKDGDVLVDGGVVVADLNERLNLDIPEGEYDTVAGFILSTLGRMACVSDTVKITEEGTIIFNDQDGDLKARTAEGEELDGFGVVSSEMLIMSVESITGNRIETVRIHRVKTTSDHLSNGAADDPNLNN
jgi:CBS domain containing-hemolysin-like protein